MHTFDLLKDLNFFPNLGHTKTICTLQLIDFHLAYKIAVTPCYLTKGLLKFNFVIFHVVVVNYTVLQVEAGQSPLHETLV